MTYEECEVEITEQSTETKCQNYTTTKIEQECRNKTEETCRQDFEYICHEYKKPHYGYPKPKPKPIGNLNSLFFCTRQLIISKRSQVRTKSISRNFCNFRDVRSASYSANDYTNNFREIDLPNYKTAITLKIFP